MVTGDYGLDDLRVSVVRAALRAPTLSDWSIGMHIHHCCLAMIRISQSLIASTPPPPRSRFSLRTARVLMTGRIPRGRGRSPQVVLPREDITPPELLTLLDQSERILAKVNRLDSRTWFRHFAFGVLKRDRALRFMCIHNQHHLSIISDIAAAELH